ncbi:D-isomer specific 2-hydroxyacid dehydrogenase [Mytilinidion resinicola]|uniref:D-isomer specific 2-hydroxyacid dehydrogenase n=1 Tax=Mytilinidion resinicola TaxID=574789 RepID=A0A6A6XZ56_9PEZI|nr:D-isomer specific 2-hydroxyacid dehydrogenase [Mytilinidion resinicola]KAF2801690.1 D-isomer specific 2-hydroxyacid dehydrogenase [Mytilinidion resinicola]
MSKPILLHLGDDIKWNHELYQQLQAKFTIKRSYSMSRADFSNALKANQFGDFVAMYRPFWNTGGEMGNWDDELISLLPKSCKIYASAGAGFDWVDTKRLAESGIIYCNAAAACTESVADAGIWLILSTFRLFSWSASAAHSASIPAFQDANRNIAAVTHNPNHFTLGIIGLGKIGHRIAQKAHAAFDMHILYHDIRRMPAAVEAPLGATYYASLDAMLPAADCVLVATPFAGDKLLDAAHFAKMKRGARLVNIARGRLIDEPALVAALASGQLGAAGLDVHYDEPKVDARLAGMRNVQLLAHTAGASVESHVGFERLGMENVLGFFETGKAVTPVNLQWIKETARL